MLYVGVPESASSHIEMQACISSQFMKNTYYIGHGVH